MTEQRIRVGPGSSHGSWSSVATCHIEKKKKLPLATTILDKKVLSKPNLFFHTNICAKFFFNGVALSI